MRGLAIVLAGAVCVSIVWTASALGQTADSGNSAKAVLEQIKAKAPPAEATAGSETAVAAQEVNDYGAFRVQQEITHRTLLLAVVGAALASLIIVLWFLKLVGTHDAVTMVNASGLVLVVYATILVVMIARADQQLTAAMGILGAVAGYLFGATTRSRAGADGDRGPKGGSPRA